MQTSAAKRKKPELPETGTLDWERVGADLDAHGCAVVGPLLSPAQCAELAALYPSDAPFRSRVIMARHGFGRGEYKYFSYPLPDAIDVLRTALYPPLTYAPQAIAIAAATNWRWCAAASAPVLVAASV